MRCHHGVRHLLPWVQLTRRPQISSPTRPDLPMLCAHFGIGDLEIFRECRRDEIEKTNTGGVRGVDGAAIVERSDLLIEVAHFP